MRNYTAQASLSRAFTQDAHIALHGPGIDAGNAARLPAQARPGRNVGELRGVAGGAAASATRGARRPLQRTKRSEPYRGIAVRGNLAVTLSGRPEGKPLRSKIVHN